MEHLFTVTAQFGKATRNVSVNADVTSFARFKEILQRLYAAEITTDSFEIKYKYNKDTLVTVLIRFCKFQKFI